LAEMDPILALLADRNGVPPLWPRDPGFPTMVRLILEQQESLASADAAFQKLERTIGHVEPEPFLGLDDPELRSIGFSRQKAGYVRGVAAGLMDGRSISVRSPDSATYRQRSNSSTFGGSDHGPRPAICCSPSVDPTSGHPATGHFRSR